MIITVIFVPNAKFFLGGQGLILSAVIVVGIGLAPIRPAFVGSGVNGIGRLIPYMGDPGGR